jgi:hypothetical protein
VPQVRQRMGRASAPGAAGGGAGAGGMRRAVSWLVRIGGIVRNGLGGRSFPRPFLTLSRSNRPLTGLNDRAPSSTTPSAASRPSTFGCSSGSASFHSARKLAIVLGAPCRAVPSLRTAPPAACARAVEAVRERARRALSRSRTARTATIAESALPVQIVCTRPSIGNSQWGSRLVRRARNSVALGEAYWPDLQRE